MELKDQFRYLVGGYYGITFIDEYDLKEYILNDVEKYIRDFVKTNSIDFDCFEEAQEVKEKVNKKTKLQDALIVLNKINGPMDLVFIIKDRLKRFK